MMEKTTQDHLGCSAASEQMPDTLHIDLPHADPDSIYFTLLKGFALFTEVDWKAIRIGVILSVDLIIPLAFFCMDIIQTVAEDIVDVVIPQVYKYMRTYGTFSPAILGLNDDRIRTYLGGSIEQALTRVLKVDVQNFVDAKDFLSSLVRYISKVVNSVLALISQTPIQESRVPVVFVSGCATSIIRLVLVILKMGDFLMVSLKNTEEEEWPFFSHSHKCALKNSVETYIYRMVTFLKSRAHSPCCETNSTEKHRKVCIRVGTDIRMLTVEDSESHGQSARGGFEDIPGAVSDSVEADSPSEGLTSITITGTRLRPQLDSRKEMKVIKDVADELVQTFLVDRQAEDEMNDDQKAALGGPEDVVKLGEFTDRLFNIIMSGKAYQIPLVPVGMRMCDTLTYRKLGRADALNTGIVTHALYMRTEEVVARCAQQVLMYSLLHFISSDSSSVLSLSPDPVFSGQLGAGDVLSALRNEARASEASGSLISQRLSDLSRAFDATDAENSELLDTPQPVVFTQAKPRLSLLTYEMLTVIGIKNIDVICEFVWALVNRFEVSEPELWQAFGATQIYASCRDISLTAIANLLVDFGPLHRMREAVTSKDPRFLRAVLSALRDQLIPTSPAPQENTAKKTICGLFKKFKRVHCKKTTTVMSLTTDQDDSELQEHFCKEESMKDQRWSGFVCQTAVSFRNMFSALARTIRKPFITCFCPEDGTPAHFWLTAGRTHDRYIP